MSRSLKRLGEIWAEGIPGEKIKSVVEWGRRFVKLVGSALSENYDPDFTPWTREPLERTDDGTPGMTVVLPIQSGKSAIGEIAICRQIACSNGGDIQYNWQNDSAADDRWAKRVEKILLACEPVMARTSKARFQWTKGLVIFPHCNLIMQGVKTARNVASDSIRFQINEEVHDEQGGWEPGKLEQAHGRLTAYWNSFAGQISNASYDGDQLHKSHLEGTQQEWEVKCPGCGLYHRMWTEWDAQRPDLGGLRYDAEGCRRGNGEYDYIKMASTIRFQMPCGFAVQEDPKLRRQLSFSGRYDKGLPVLKRSYRMEAVAIDYIPFIKLIEQKHKALKALKYGDAEPYSVYLRERECKFFKRGMQPVATEIVLSQAKKDRGGLPGRNVRLGAGDYQKGEISKGELPHWWHLIVDVEIMEDGRIHVLIVSEGKKTTDEDLVDVFARHELMPSCVILDSSWNSPHVYQICLKQGYYAVKGEDGHFYAGHSDGSRKIYSPPKPLHAMHNQPPKFPYVTVQGQQVAHPQEPMFIRYSKVGLMNRVNWLRTSSTVEFEVPSDVSADFIAHLDAWRLVKRPNPRSQVVEEVWKQQRDRDDLLQCLCYVALLMEDAGFIGANVEEEKPGKSEPR